MLIDYVRSIITPRNIAESHRNAQRRERARTAAERGEKEGGAETVSTMNTSVQPPMAQALSIPPALSRALSVLVRFFEPGTP